ncbi:MAG TPA: hypothetical protein VIM01_08460 [Dermatophilaceae bacterium]
MLSPLEGLVFHTKSRKEQLQDHSVSLADTAATVADQLRERVFPAVGQAAENAVEWGQPHVEAARQWAKPRVEHGIEVAAPKLESAVSALAPKVDTARDKIVDELLPRVTEAITAWAAASAAAKDEAVSRGAGAVAIISGDAVASRRHKKWRKVVLTLGLLSAAGAAVAALMKKSAPKDDPWATPLEDPYVAPSSGRHSKLESVDTVDVADEAGATDKGDPLPAEATDAGGSEILEAMDEDGLPDPLAPPSAVGTPPKNVKDKDKGKSE